jgi:hypothetical protein
MFVPSIASSVESSKQKIPGEPLIEVIGDVGYNGLGAVLPLEFVDRPKAQALGL